MNIQEPQGQGGSLFLKPQTQPVSGETIFWEFPIADLLLIPESGQVYVFNWCWWGIGRKISRVEQLLPIKFPLAVKADIALLFKIPVLKVNFPFDGTGRLSDLATDKEHEDEKQKTRR
jgi:hypothetical protein